MRSISELLEMNGIKSISELDLDGSVTDEMQVVQPGSSGLSRFTYHIEGSIIERHLVQHPLIEKMYPHYYLIGTDVLMTIIEVLDLGDFPVDPEHHSRIQNLKALFLEDEDWTLIGCDSSYLMSGNGMQWVAYTEGSEYPLDPIHCGCGLDLIHITRIEGTLTQSMVADLERLHKVHRRIDDHLGSEVFGH